MAMPLDKNIATKEYYKITEYKDLEKCTLNL